MARLIEITGKALSGEWGLEDETGTGTPVLRTTNFTNDGTVNYDDIVTRTINTKKRGIEDKYLRYGDIIIEKSGGSDKQPVGRVIFFDGPDDTYLFNNFTGLLRVRNQNKWLPKYVFYSLFSNYCNGGTRQFENKTTGLHNLKTDNYVNSHDVPESSLEQQQIVCEQLDKIRFIINSRQKEIEKLDELVKARFVEMFGDLKSNSKKWTIVNFTECAKIDTNMVHDFDKYKDYPHIGIDSIEKDTGRLNGYRTVAEDCVISGKYLFTDKHIIYSKIRPNLNKVAMPDFVGVCSADAYPILPKTTVCVREYLAYVMRGNYFLDYILAFSNRTNLPKVNKKQVEGFMLPLPPLDLQQRFADFVVQVDKSKAVVQRQINDLQELFDKKMDEYFGGDYCCV